MIVRDFDLQQTLECGQCFNFERLADHEYIVIACGRVLHVTQRMLAGDITAKSCKGAAENDNANLAGNDNAVSAGNDNAVSAGNDNVGLAGKDFSGESELDFGGASEADIRDIWIPYFDLDRDYDEIKQGIIEAEPRLADVIEQYSGLRILNQEFPETLLSFIISQNKNIPQIKKIVRSICEEFGGPADNKAAEAKDKCSDKEQGAAQYRTFPSMERLFRMSEQDFRSLKTGFRAPYLVNAIRSMEEGLDGDKLRKMTFEQAKAELTAIKGVGDKVANCVLLFSLGFRDAFPVDVWIKRIMEEMYFGCDTDKKVIEAFAREKFGKWGGYAQQYLFMYAREK